MAPNLEHAYFGVKITNRKLILTLLLLDVFGVAAAMTSQEDNLLLSRYSFIKYSFTKDFTACCFNINRCTQYIS